MEIISDVFASSVIMKGSGKLCDTVALADFPERTGLQVIIVPVGEFLQKCQ